MNFPPIIRLNDFDYPPHLILVDCYPLLSATLVSLFFLSAIVHNFRLKSYMMTKLYCPPLSVALGLKGPATFEWISSSGSLALNLGSFLGCDFSLDFPI